MGSRSLRLRGNRKPKHISHVLLSSSGTEQGNLASASCDSQRNLYLFTDGHCFSVCAAYFCWPGGWRRPDAGLPELRSPAEWGFSSGRHSSHTGDFDSAALDRRGDRGGTAAAASFRRGQWAVPYPAIQNREPGRPKYAVLRHGPAFRDLGASSAGEIPIPPPAGKTVR